MQIAGHILQTYTLLVVVPDGRVWPEVHCFMHAITLAFVVTTLLLCALHFCGGFGLALLLIGRRATRRDGAIAAEHADMQSTVIQLSKSLDACHGLAIRQLQRIQTIVDCEVKRLAKGVDQDAFRRLNEAAEELRKSNREFQRVLETGRNATALGALRLDRRLSERKPIGEDVGRVPLEPAAADDQKTDWLDAKCSQRVVFRCTQRFTTWDRRFVPPLEKFRTMQCLEISTKEIVFDCEDVGEQGDVLIGLETAAAGLVLLRGVIMQRHALSGTNQLRFRCLCRLVERLDPSSARQPRATHQPQELRIKSGSRGSDSR